MPLMRDDRCVWALCGHLGDNKLGDTSRSPLFLFIRDSPLTLNLNEQPTINNLLRLVPRHRQSTFGRRTFSVCDPMA